MSETQWKRARDVIARRIAGEMVLVPVGQRTANPEHRAAELFVLNESGAAMWEMLAAPCTAEQLARNLLTQYDVTPERAHGDVEHFLAALMAVAAIERVEDGDATGR